MKEAVPLDPVAEIYSKPAASLSEDAEYQEMRRGRMKLFNELIERSKPG
jgi:hypothetical protein